MKKRIHILLVVCIVAAWACGSSDDDPRPPVSIEIPEEVTEEDAVLAENAGASDLMVQKALEFRRMMSVADGKKAGVYVYSSKSVQKYKNNPARLAARLALLGFTDVYLSMTKGALTGEDATACQWLKTFNENLHTYGMKVHALRFSDTQMYVSNTKIYEDAEGINIFNASTLNPAQRLDGVSADLEPHVLKQNGADTPQGLQYFWDSANNYGKGNSNDKLIKKTLDILQIAQQEVTPLPLSEAISYLYQPKFNEGQLTWGNTPDFLTYCNHVIVMSYYNKKETVWNRSKPVLTAAAAKQESVFVCIKTSLNTYGDGGEAVTSLQPEGWNYLMETLKYLHTSAKDMKAMKGVCIFEFEGMEQMWEWLNDKN